MNNKLPRWKKWKLLHRKYMNCLTCGLNFDYPANTQTRKYCNRKCQPRLKLTENHKKKIGLGVKNSEKYIAGLKLRNYPKNSGQFGNGRNTKGQNHYNWKGGITPINDSIRKSLEYEEWRKAILERDNYTCQHCNQVGGYLEVDHIKPFAYFPELRFELSNGRTLCHECHKKTSTYGGRSRWIQPV